MINQDRRGLNLTQHNFIIYIAQNTWVYDLMLFTLLYNAYNTTMKWIKNNSFSKLLIIIHSKYFLNSDWLKTHA